MHNVLSLFMRDPKMLGEKMAVFLPIPVMVPGTKYMLNKHVLNK